MRTSPPTSAYSYHHPIISKPIASKPVVNSLLATKVGQPLLIGPNASNKYGLNLPKVMNGEYYRLLTHTFIHANYIHLCLNMISLVDLGPEFAQRFGIASLLGLGALSVATHVFSKYITKDNNTVDVGFSGVLYAMEGALIGRQFLLQSSSASIDQIKRLAVRYIISTVVLQSTVGKISHLGHASGLFSGLAFGCFSSLMK